MTRWLWAIVVLAIFAGPARAWIHGSAGGGGGGSANATVLIIQD